MIAFQLVKKPPLGRNGIKYAISMKVLMIIKFFTFKKLKYREYEKT